MYLKTPPKRSLWAHPWRAKAKYRFGGVYMLGNTRRVMKAAREAVTMKWSVT